MTKTAETDSKVVFIDRKRHVLPPDVILINMVDFRRIGALPVNRDCTGILNASVREVLYDMFGDRTAYAETFLPRQAEFNVRLGEAISRLRHRQWRRDGENDNPPQDLSVAEEVFF